MAGVAVLGASPITFVSEDTGGSDTGVQFQVPLSALTIVNGTVDHSGWTAPGAVTATDMTNLEALMKNLLARGVIWVAKP